MKRLLVLAIIILSFHHCRLSRKVEEYHAKKQLQVDTVEVYGFDKQGSLRVVSTRLDTSAKKN